jgi:hypothetical protein
VRQETRRAAGDRIFVVADQPELIVRRDPGINEVIGDDGDDGRTKVDQDAGNPASD